MYTTHTPTVKQSMYAAILIYMCLHIITDHKHAKKTLGFQLTET